MVVVQAAEIWEELGDWIKTNKPELGPGTKERFQMASQLQPDEVPCYSSGRAFLCVACLWRPVAGSLAAKLLSMAQNARFLTNMTQLYVRNARLDNLKHEYTWFRKVVLVLMLINKMLCPLGCFWVQMLPVYRPTA